MLPQDGNQQARAAAEEVARSSYGKLVAYLAARTRDVAAAEDALSDAFAAALVDWPESGIPKSPEAWLLAVARRKAIDVARRRRSADEGADQVRMMTEELEAAADVLVLSVDRGPRHACCACWGGDSPTRPQRQKHLSRGRRLRASGAPRPRPPA